MNDDGETVILQRLRKVLWCNSSGSIPFMNLPKSANSIAKSYWNGYYSLALIDSYGVAEEAS